MEKTLIQCSLKVSFQGHTNPEKYESPNKTNSFKA